MTSCSSRKVILILCTVLPGAVRGAFALLLLAMAAILPPVFDLPPWNVSRRPQQ